MYKVYIKDYIGQWWLYHITSKDNAYSLKEKLENNLDIYGVRVIPPERKRRQVNEERYNS